jgi:hypothetical protein
VFFWLRRIPEFRTNLAGGQNRGRHLIKQRLENVMICAVDQKDIGRSIPKSLGGCQSAKTPSDDYYLNHYILNAAFREFRNP